MKTRKIHTHYDNLKISRNAPLEVIRAAYKALSQKYHPDKNPRPDASKVMAIINHSYAVLSDERARRKHDEWIAAQEARGYSSSDTHTSFYDTEPEQAASHSDQTDRVPAGEAWAAYLAPYLTPRRILIASGGLTVFVLLLASSLHRPPATLTTMPALPPEAYTIRDQSDDKHEKAITAIADASAAESKKSEVSVAEKRGETVDEDVLASPKISLGPDGQPWPLGPKIYRKNRFLQNGLSTITIDNSHNRHPIHVKLDAESRPDEVIREIFVPRHRLMALENLPPGMYRLKYRDLQTGSAMQSQAFDLDDVRTEPPVQYGAMEITLYATPNDNVGFSALPESEF